MQFSFIIPLYNGEKFIEKCVQSILNQSFEKNDFEILIVDDGSTDDSRNISEALAEKYAEVSCFSKANAGPGHSRNYGLDRAKGTYIWYVDADDYLEPGIIREFYARNIPNQDIYIFGYRALDLKGEEIREVRYPEGLQSPEALIQHECYINTVWCKLISKKLLRQTGIRFREDIRGPEDFHFSFRLMMEANNIQVLDLIAYNYIENPSSLMNTRTDAHMKRLAEDSMEAGIDLQKYLETFPDKKKGLVFKDWLANYFYGLLFSLFRFNYQPSYISQVLKRLRSVACYPIRLHSNNSRKKLFMSIANREKVFRSVIWLKRRIPN